MMKLMSVSSLLSTLLIISICTISSSLHDAVLDIDGNPLHPGDLYYMLPIMRDGGGLALGQMENSNSCPLYVTLEENKRIFKDLPFNFKFQSFGGISDHFRKFLPVNEKENLGMPVKVMPVNKRDKVVELSRDVYIMFEENHKSAGKCDRFSPVWQVEESVKSPYKGQPMRYVKIGGEIPGKYHYPKSSKSIFKIVEAGSRKEYYYKIEYCSTPCAHCHEKCESLGMVKKDGKMYVGVGDVDRTLYVEFKKVA